MSIGRLLLAIVLGVITTSLLEFFGVFNQTIDILIGFAVGLLIYFEGFRS